MPAATVLLHILLIALQLPKLRNAAGMNHTEMTKNVTETLNRLLDNYDRNLRPNFGQSPILVRVNMNIRSMGPISERSMIYAFDCYFRQEWIDTRLTFPTHDNFTHLQLNEKMLREIWKPDTYIVNGMGSYLHNITSPNVLFRIKNTGEILYSMRLTIKATCPMDLIKFPMDRQTCPLEISSHGYTDDDVIFDWGMGSRSIQLNKDLLLSQFDLKKTSISKATKYIGRRGRFSVLVCDFELHRHMGYFLIQLYFPCSLLVVLSWVGFWINREATSDRIELSTTTVLTMTFLGMDNRQDLPRVNYGTALDWYVGMCFALILATIIEFASVHYFTKMGSGECHLTLEVTEDENRRDGDGSFRGELRYGQARPEGFRQRQQPPQSSPAPGENGGGGGGGSGTAGSARSLSQSPAVPPRQHKHHQLRYDAESCPYAFFNCIRGSSKYKQVKLARRQPHRVNSVSQIDQISKVLFPAMFCIFNVVYWTVYLKIL